MKLVDGLLQLNRVQYLSKGLNLLVILKTSIKITINRMLHIHVLMVSQFGGSGIAHDGHIPAIFSVAESFKAPG